MKLNSMTTIFRRAAATSIAALCLIFAGTAKADCGIATTQRAAFAPDGLAAANKLTAMLGGGSVHANTSDSFSDGSVRANALPGPASDLSRGIGGGNDPITGLWFTTFTIGGQTVDQGFGLWSSDGLEILNDNPPPASGNVCLGTWVKTGPNDYKLYHPSWTFDNNGNVNGMAIIHESITLAADRESYKGSFTIDVVTLAGAPVQHLAGSISGTRITVN